MNGGVGATDLRVVGQAIWTWEPKPEPPPTWSTSPPPRPDPDDESYSARFVDWDDGCWVRVDRLVIRETIPFEPDTDELISEALELVDYVAGILHAAPEIGFLVVEGHASAEGPPAASYRLAEGRARRVWERLLERGVAYARLGYRTAGHVRPVRGTLGDTSLSPAEHAENHRVEFHIVHQLEADEIPDYPARHYLPWSGAVVDVVTPALPEPILDDAHVRTKNGHPVDAG